MTMTENEKAAWQEATDRAETYVAGVGALGPSTNEDLARAYAEGWYARHFTLVHLWSPTATALCSCGAKPDHYGLPTDSAQWWAWEAWHREHAAANDPTGPELERVAAMLRLLLDSGDITPTAQRQITRLWTATLEDL